MLSFAIYCLQVIICSGIMMLYYGLVLRNKRFHQYNRFYILSVFLLSWLIPLGKIYLFDNAQKPVPQFLYMVANGNEYMDEIVVKSGFHIDWWLLATLTYFVICLFFVAVFVKAFVVIDKLKKSNPKEFVQNFWIVFTDVAGTPFSFFRYVFWNKEVDMNSSAGKQMLQHELVHVNEKHTIDSVLVQIILCAGWFNPFFWIAKKELNVIHEFIADKKSVENGDTAAFAAMLLAAAYPQHHQLLTNSFFFSPIKRRLFMLTQSKKPKFSYMRRLVILPLLAIVVLLFAFRIKHEEKIKAEKQQTPITALTTKDTLPKNVLFILDGQKCDSNVLKTIDPKQIESINVLKDPTSVEKFGEEGKNGVVEIFLKKKIGERKDSSFKTLGYGNAEATIIKDGSVIKADSIVFVTTGDQKETNGSPLYIVDGRQASKEEIPTGNNIERIDVLKGESATVLYGKAAENGVILITTRSGIKKTETIHGTGYPSLTGAASDKRLPQDYRDFLDKNKDVKSVSWKWNPQQILEIQMKDGTKEEYNLENETRKQKAIERYGILPMAPPPPPNQKSEGVVVKYTPNEAQNNKVFTVVQIPASFPGGREAWQKYLQRNLDADMPVKKGAPPGTYTVVVSFIVDKDGNISDVKSENNPGYGTATEAIRVIKQGPAWLPAVQNGRNVICRHRQTITFKISNR